MPGSGERILVLSLHYRPEPNFITADVAERLARKGYDVTVVTAHPNYPLGRFYNSVGSLWPSRSVENGVTVWRLPFFPDHSKSKMKRFLSYTSFTLAASLFAPFAAPSPRVVWVYNAPFTTGIASLWFRYARRAKVAFLCPDLWPESFPASGVAPAEPILSFMYAYSRWIHRRAHLLVATTRGMARRYEADGYPVSRIRFVPLWVDGASAGAPEGGPAGGPERGGAMRLVYAGNLGPAQALDVVLRGVRRLAKEGVEIDVDFYGAGSEEERLRALVGELGLTRVHFKGRVSPEEALRASAEATGQIVHLTPSPLFEMTVPSKLAFCLAAGKPVLAGVAGEARDVARESGGAVVFTPGSEEDFARAVRELLGMSGDERRAMGARGRRYFEENLKPEILCEKYVDMTAALLGEARAEEAAETDLPNRQRFPSSTGLEWWAR